MIDFKAVKAGEKTVAELVRDFDQNELRDLTNEMVDTMLDIIKNCDDADVTFQPHDPAANDTFAATEDEVGISWTLGHVIVHATASSEEGAFVAAEMARGIRREGRSRYEVDWETVTTIAQCRARLEESRRIRLATLNVWPDEPHLDVSYEVEGSYGARTGTINALVRFSTGLMHDADHLDQLRDIVSQAEAAKVRE